MAPGHPRHDVRPAWKQFLVPEWRAPFQRGHSRPPEEHATERVVLPDVVMAERYQRV